MFLLGLLSLLQIIILPGLLIVKIFNLKSENLLQTFLYSLGLSLSFNYYLVCILVFLRIYLPIIIFIIFLMEMLILLYLIIKEKIKIPLKKSARDFYYSFSDYSKNLSGIHKILLLVSSLLLLFFISLVFVNAGTTYYFVDTTLMKTWVHTWSTNHFMIYSHYPQLMATNFSINYLFMNETSVDFFSKAIMPLFFIGILLIFYDLSLKRKRVVHLTGFILYSYILLIFYGILFISDFNNDIPVSFFGFLSFYVILKRKHTSFDLQTVLLVAFFAVSAANTKLVGLYVVGLSALWIAFYMFSNKSEILKKDFFRSLKNLAVIYIVGLFWYLIFPLLMSAGVGSSPYRPYNGLIESFFYGTQLISINFGKIFSVIILISLFSALITETRKIVLFVIAPLFFIWALWYCYDCRNLSLIIPFTAYASAFGIEFIFKKLSKRIKYLGIQKNNSNTRLPTIKNHKILSSLFFILFLIMLFIIVNTDFFFNFGIKTAYFFRSFYFNYNSLVYTSELGYYKYVMYFVTTISVLIILTLVIFLLRKSNIKVFHLIIILIIGTVILNFTLLKRENILLCQKADKEFVKIHNLYFGLHSYLANTNAIIFTNSPLFGNLIFPQGVEVKYFPELNQDIISRNIEHENVRYVLLEKNKISDQINRDYDFIAKDYTTYLNINNFIFFGLPLRNKD